MIGTILLWVLAVSILLAIILAGREEKRCPRCRGELQDSGYEGIKKWCAECGWRNYGDH